MTSTRETLLEAKLWCEYRLQQDPKYRPRTHDLRPRRHLFDVFQHEAKFSHEEWARWYLSKLPEVSSIIDEVVVRRSLLVHELCLPKTMPVPVSGDLLCYYPARATGDREALQASSGLFDRDDAPGWDSWVHYAIDLERIEDLVSGRVGLDCLDALICWVPDAFLTRVRKGVQAHPGRAIEWLADTEHADKDELLRALE